MFKVNGKSCTFDLDGNVNLLSVLRDELQLNGPKFGCGVGECGACMVLVDGKPMPSCDLPLWSLAGKEVVTLEGLGTPEAPHPLQLALLEERAGQCGYCLPGVIVSAAALLARTASPTRTEICSALDRNLCRCGSHVRIVRAIEKLGQG